MPTARYFPNTLPDFAGGAVAINPAPALLNFKQVLNSVLTYGSGHRKPSVYTGTAGIAYALWHAHRRAAQLESAVSEQQLLESAEQYARSAAEAVQRQPPEQYGWSLLAGHAGVYCTAALVLHASAELAERQGRWREAEGLRQERQQYVQQYDGLYRLACSRACQEDEVLYGRSGYLLGALLLNRQVAEGSVPSSSLQAVVEAVIASGRSLAARLRDPASFPTPLLYLWPPGPEAFPYLGAAHGLMGRRQAAATPGCPSPLYYYWHDKPYLGAAHGMIGILYALLQVPDLVAGVPGGRADVEGALRYVLSLECDADGQPGPHGHYPTQMGPWRDREPLVHWCHGATGAVFLFCKAHEQLGAGGSGGSGGGSGSGGSSAYLAAAERSGEAVWERGLLKKGPGSCHGVSGSAYALLRLYRSTGQDRWLYRAWQMAQFMESPEFRSAARTPDHPHSLFEGRAAELCLWADLLQPSAAGFPMFEPDI